MHDTAYIAGSLLEHSQKHRVHSYCVVPAVYTYITRKPFSGRLHSFLLLSHFRRIKNSLVMPTSRSRCSRILASEKRRRPRSRQRPAGCLYGNSTPGGIHSSESERTEFFAIGSGNATAVDDAGVLRYCGRHGRGEILSGVSMHFLSLSGGSDFPSSDCPNRLVRDDDAAVVQKI
jgi:hypothetical protein